MTALKSLLATALVCAIAGAAGMTSRPALAATPWGDAPAVDKPPMTAVTAPYSCTAQPAVTPEQSGTPSRRIPGEWTLVFTTLSPAVLQWEKATVLLCAPGGCAAPLSLDLPPMSPGATYSSTVGGLTPEGGAITIAVNSCAVTGVTGAKSK